jgi:hypothetical protein
LEVCPSYGRRSLQILDPWPSTKLWILIPSAGSVPFRRSADAVVIAPTTIMSDKEEEEEEEETAEEEVQASSGDITDLSSRFVTLMMHSFLIVRRRFLRIFAVSPRSFLIHNIAFVFFFVFLSIQ